MWTCCGYSKLELGGKSGEGIRKNVPIRRSIAQRRVGDRLESQGRALLSNVPFFHVWTLMENSRFFWPIYGWELEKKSIPPSFRRRCVEVEGGGAG